jgi:DNA transformation protein and related proteins
VAASAGFLDFIKEQMAGFGPVTVRRMFGGAGFYRDGVMFGLVADDTLYFKADNETLQLFERQGSSPFAYGEKGRRTVMSYWRAPEACLDYPEEMVRWAEIAHGAALRSRNA